MFPEFKVVSASGCTQVMTYVKAYKTIGLPQKVFGIIDCDYRGQDYLDSLISQNIYHMPFFEIENFLFSEKILKKMIYKYSSELDKESVFKAITESIKELFVKKKDEWVAKHVAFDLRDKFEYRGKIKQLNNLTEFKILYNKERKEDKEIDAIAKSFELYFEEVVSNGEYNLILRHLDHKGLMSQFEHILKLENKMKYEEGVFYLFNTEEGDELLKELRNDYFPDIKS